MQQKQEKPPGGKTYFKNLFLHNKTNSKIMKLIFKNRKVKHFNQHLRCSVDDMYTDYRNALSLKNICLLYLHVNLVHCTENIKPDKNLICTIDSATVIVQLNIPQTLINELLNLYIQCPRHVLLYDFINNKVPFNRYALNESSNLFINLQSNPLWNKKFNYALHNLPELVSKIIECRQIDTSRIGNLEYNVLLREVKLSCKEFTYFCHM